MRSVLENLQLGGDKLAQVYFKLGGLTRDTPEGISPTGEVQLSGINAPLFNGSRRALALIVTF